MKKNIEKQYNYCDCILNLFLIFPAKKNQTKKTKTTHEVYNRMCYITLLVWLKESKEACQFIRRKSFPGTKFQRKALEIYIQRDFWTISRTISTVIDNFLVNFYSPHFLVT